MADVAVQLQKEHRHNGLLRPAGSFIELPKHLADMLVAQRIAKIVAAAPRMLNSAPRPVRKRGCCGRG